VKQKQNAKKKKEQGGKTSLGPKGKNETRQEEEKKNQRSSHEDTSKERGEREEMTDVHSRAERPLNGKYQQQKKRGE